MGKAELKIDADLLAQAQAAGVPVERVAEEAVRSALRQADPTGAEERAATWIAENAEAIDDYNRRIRERGMIGDEYRKW
jgi:post-segregation antitoxin (ccd killing protein)